MISPEQWTAIVGAIVLLIIALILFGRWLFFDHIPKLLDEKLQADKQGREEEAKEAEAKRKIELLEIQSQLDATQSGREMNRLLLSEMAESRKESDKRMMLMQESFSKRDEQNGTALLTIGATLSSFETIASTQLELLKNHVGSDKLMAQNQDKIMGQNQETHTKIEGLSTKLSAIEDKVESILQSNQNIRQAIIDDIKTELTGVKLDIQHLEQLIIAPKPETVTQVPANTVSEKSESEEKHD